MNIEKLDYALATAGVGMGIVFFALIVLSLMMLVIRAVFADRSAPVDVDSEAKNGSERTGTNESEPDEKDEDGVPRWVLAGAVAYLLAEERERAPWASPWTSRPARQ